MTADQVARWKQALAEHGKNSRGGPGVRYRQRQTGLAALSGAGHVRIPAPQPPPRGKTMPKPARKFKVGDPVIWTDYSDGKQYACEILGFVEPEPDEHYDLVANGPLYVVHLKRTRDTQVAEVNLSPWPRPSLTVA